MDDDDEDYDEDYDDEDYDDDGGNNVKDNNNHIQTTLPFPTLPKPISTISLHRNTHNTHIFDNNRTHHPPLHTDLQNPTSHTYIALPSSPFPSLSPTPTPTPISPPLKRKRSSPRNAHLNISPSTPIKDALPSLARQQACVGSPHGGVLGDGGDEAERCGSAGWLGQSHEDTQLTGKAHTASPLRGGRSVTDNGGSLANANGDDDRLSGCDIPTPLASPSLSPTKKASDTVVHTPKRRRLRRGWVEDVGEVEDDGEDGDMNGGQEGVMEKEGVSEDGDEDEDSDIEENEDMEEEGDVESGPVEVETSTAQQDGRNQQAGDGRKLTARRTKWRVDGNEAVTRMQLSIMHNLRQQTPTDTQHQQTSTSDKDSNIPLNRTTRAILVDWIGGIAGKFKTRAHTFALAVRYFDKLLSCRFPTKENAQVIAGVCFLIACKMEEDVLPRMVDIAFVCGEVGADEVMTVEMNIMKQLDFKVCIQTAATVLQWLCRREARRGVLKEGLKEAVDGEVEGRAQCVLRLGIFALAVGLLDAKLACMNDAAVAIGVTRVAMEVEGLSGEGIADDWNDGVWGWRDAAKAVVEAWCWVTAEGKRLQEGDGRMWNMLDLWNEEAALFEERREELVALGKTVESVERD